MYVLVSLASAAQRRRMELPPPAAVLVEPHHVDKGGRVQHKTNEGHGNADATEACVRQHPVPAIVTGKQGGKKGLLVVD
jgi:hypothetical protein